MSTVVMLDADAVFAIGAAIVLVLLYGFAFYSLRYWRS